MIPDDNGWRRTFALFKVSLFTTHMHKRMKSPRATPLNERQDLTHDATCLSFSVWLAGWLVAQSVYVVAPKTHLKAIRKFYDHVKSYTTTGGGFFFSLLHPRLLLLNLRTY